MQLQELCEFIDTYLEIERFQDYCPNGLQVEANPEVRHVVCGVTACQALIDAAREAGADTLLVHHGYFWKGEGAPLSGVKGRRIASLMRHGINLLAYHLPLDAHPEVGNNARLGARMGWRPGARFGEQDLIVEGETAVAQTLAELAADLEARLDTRVLAIDAGGHPVRRLAWCTGAAQGFIEAAAARGVDAFVSGEISEQTVHLARELGVHYLAAGHHATERYGVQALAGEIESRFPLRLQFIDIPNPV